MGLEESNDLLKTDKPEVKSEVKIPKKEDENAQKHNDIFMSQFEYDGDRGSYELLKMIKGAIDEDPTQRNLAQNAINNNATNTNVNASNTGNQESSNIGIEKGDNNALKNDSTFNLSYENFKKDLLKYDGIDVSKTENKEEKEGTKLLNIQIGETGNKNNEKIYVKTGPKEQRSLDEILAEIKNDKKEMEEMKREEEKKKEEEKELEEEDSENELEGFKLDDIMNSGADIEFNLPENYMPNFESPVYSVITMLMDKYGFEFIIDKLVKNGSKKKHVEERKEEINMGNENFNMGDNMGDNLWDDRKEVSNLEEKKEEVNKEEKKEIENVEEKKEGADIKENNDNNNNNNLNMEITNENKNGEEKKEENKVEEKAEEKLPEIPKEEPNNEAPKEEVKTEVPKEEVKAEVPQEEKKVENLEEKKEENNLENKDGKMDVEEEKKTNEPVVPGAENENKKEEEEKKEKEDEKHMNDDLWNGMDIDNGAMIPNNENHKKIHELNMSLHSVENETEEDAKLRKVLNSLVTMGGYSNIIYFVVQYSNYLNSINPDKKAPINPLFEDDGPEYEEYLNMEESHTRLLTEREIIKLKREPNSGNNLSSINNILMPLKKEKEKEKPAPKKTAPKQTSKPVYPDDDRKYYQRGGRVGMHYFTSKEDGNIYKYYCIQYNNDGTYGFKCSENQCRSKALLDRNKNFNILSGHTMDFRDHKKLHGSYLRDRFIKFMLQKSLKEIQLTKKDDKKVIEWYK